MSIFKVTITETTERKVVAFVEAKDATAAELWAAKAELGEIACKTVEIRSVDSTIEATEPVDSVEPGYRLNKAL